MDAGGALGEVSVDVYADLSRLNADFNTGRAKTEKFSKDMQATVGKAAKAAARETASLDRATSELARAYSPLHAAQIRYANDLEKIGRLQKAQVFNSQEVAMFTDKATAAYKRAGLEQSKMYQFGQKAGAQIRQWGALALAGAAAGAIAIVKSSFDQAKAIEAVSAKLKMSAEAWQKWQYVARQTNVESSEMEQGFEALQNSVGKAAASASREAALFDRLGIKLTDAGGKAKNTDAIMRELSDGLLRITDANQRAAVGAILLGENYAEIAPALAGGSQNINDLGDAAERLGMVISEAEIKKLGEGAKKYEDIKTILSARISGVVAGNADAIVDFGNSFVTFTDTVLKALKAYQDFVKWLDEHGLPNPLDPTAGAKKLIGSAIPSSPSTPSYVQRIDLSKTGAAKATKPTGPPIDASDILAGKTPKGRTGARSDPAALGNMVAVVRELYPTARITSTTGGTHKKDSDHYAGRAIDFVIPGMMNPAGTAEVEAKLEAAGVDIRRNAKGTKQLFGPGRPAEKPGDHDDHFHMAFQGSLSPEKMAEERERQAKKRSQMEERYQHMLAGLQDSELQARLSEATDSEEIASLRKEQVNREHKRYNDDLQLSVAQGDIAGNRAAELKTENDKRRDAELRQIDADKMHALAQQSFEVANATLDRDIEYLSSMRDLAETNGDRNALESQILEKTFEQRRLAIDQIASDTTISQTRRDIAAADLKQLDASRELARQLQARAAMNPVEQFFFETPHTDKQIDEALLRKRASLLVEQRDRAVQFADDVGAAFGNMARSIANLENPLQILQGLLADLAHTFTEEALVRPIQNWARQKIGGPLAEKVVGAGAGPEGLSVKVLDSAGFKLGVAADRLIFAAQQLSMSGGTGSATIDSLLSEGPIGGADVGNMVLDLGAAASEATSQLSKFGDGLPAVIQSLLSAGPIGGGGGGGTLQTILGIASMVAGGLSPGGIARSNLTVGSTIASHPGIFHDGGEIGPNAMPIRRPLRPGEVNITAKVGERVIKAGPSKRMAGMLDAINAGKLPTMPAFAMPMQAPRAGDTRNLSLSMGDIHLNGGNGDERASRRSAKVFAAELNFQIAKANKTGVMRRD